MSSNNLFYGFKTKYGNLENSNAIRIENGECIINTNCLLKYFLINNIHLPQNVFAYNKFMREFILKLKKKAINYRFEDTYVDEIIFDRLANEFINCIFLTHDKNLYKEGNIYYVVYQKVDVIKYLSVSKEEASRILCYFANFGFDPIYGTVHCPILVDCPNSEMVFEVCDNDKQFRLVSKDKTISENVCKEYKTITPPMPSMFKSDDMEKVDYRFLGAVLNAEPSCKIDAARKTLKVK